MKVLSTISGGSKIKCALLFALQITPPFKPQVTDDTDTRYFDSEFTGESVELTPPENPGPLNTIAEELDPNQPYFPQFSYSDLSSTLSASSSSLAQSAGAMH